MESVFEVIDSTNDEMYFTLGIFQTLEAAKNDVLKVAKTSDPITEYGCDGDYEEVTIEERKIGWTGRGNVVFTINRENKYDDEVDDNNWVTTFNSDSPEKAQDA